MPYKVQPGKELARMEAAVERKLRELSVLEAENERLALEHQLLSSAAELLHWLRRQQRRASAAPGATDGAELSMAADAELVPLAEMQLLEQLQGLPLSSSSGSDPRSPSSSSEASSAAPGGGGDGGGAAASGGAASSVGGTGGGGGGGDPASRTLAPEGDPLALLRTLLGQPPHPLARTLSVEALRADYGGVIRELALQLQLLDSPFAGELHSEHPLATITNVLSRHLAIMTSLALLGRDELASQFSLTNAATGEAVEEQRPEVYAWAVRRLGLSAAQQRRIVACVRVFRRLAEPVIAAKGELQKQLRGGAEAAAADDAPPPPEVHAAGVGAAFADCRAAVVQQQARFMQAREHQAAQLRLLNVLLKKEAFLRLAVSASAHGCLTWPQAAKLSVIVWPYALHYTEFARAVELLYEEAQAAQPGEAAPQSGKAAPGARAASPVQPRESEDASG
ncbi:hypothetical protein HT031_004928 [Scenedesmus sp. PABB004]|nr:hypothetical protein HT031_004928 [Scenedesmus sp. PABB004]